MAFQLKDFASITLAMINRARASQSKLTDFNEGSIARTLMESPAVEIEELYQRMFAGILDAIPVAIYRGFGFDMREPAKARGSIMITFGAALAVPFTLPAGAVFQNAATGYRYLLTAAATANVGATSLTVIVEAENTGAIYNTAANAVSLVLGITLPTGSVITHSPITSGSDGESPIERATRFAEFIQSISRGTPKAVRYGASTAKIRNIAGEVIEYVSRVGFEEIPGEVKVYIYGSGEVASTALIAAAQRITDGYWDGTKYIEGYRAAGVNALVIPMTESPFGVGVTVELAAGYELTTDLRNDIVTRVSAAIEDVWAGETLYVENVRQAVLRAPGVTKARLNLDENHLCPPNIVLTPGAITVAAA